MAVIAGQDESQPSSSVGAEGLCFEAGVPGYLVHRHNAELVLLTDWRATGSDSFLCGARVFAAQGFYRPLSSGHYDPLLFAERVRQAGIFVAHVGYGVTQNVHFVMHGLRVEVTGDLLVSDKPCDLVLHTHVHHLARSGSRLRGFVIDVAFMRGGEFVASGSGSGVGEQWNEKSRRSPGAELT